MFNIKCNYKLIKMTKLIFGKLLCYNKIKTIWDILIGMNKQPCEADLMLTDLFEGANELLFAQSEVTDWSYHAAWCGEQIQAWVQACFTRLRN